MGSGGVIDRDAISAAFDALDAAIEGVAGLSFDALVPRECLALLERCEKTRRRLPVGACHSICVSPGWSKIGPPLGRTEGVFCDEDHAVVG